MTQCVSFCHGDKISKISNVKEERFILAHGVRGFGPWLAGPLLLECGESEHHTEGD